MYKWVTHLWSPISGCPHQCTYCYVRTFKELSANIKIDKTFPNLGTGRTLFVGYECDMFAQAVPLEMIDRVMEHLSKYLHNINVLQSKNPMRIWNYLRDWQAINAYRLSQMRFIIGTTIETNRAMMLRKISGAPSPIDRAEGIGRLKGINRHAKTFVTIEPILDFDVDEMHNLIRVAKPSFVNIGADSKNHKLNEPTPEKINCLISLLSNPTDANPIPIMIKLKSNLSRLMKERKK